MTSRITALMLLTASLSACSTITSAPCEVASLGASMVPAVPLVPYANMAIAAPIDVCYAVLG